MCDWRANIVQEFVPQAASLTLVADPDGLLFEEGVLASIRERGFEILKYEDPIEFRFALACKRASTDGPESILEVVVACAGPDEELDRLPYDLIESARRLYFSLGELFPNLSYPVIAALDRGYFDALYRAQSQYNPGQLGDDATKDFVLRHVFEIAPELIKKPSDLLRVLLRRHHRGQQIPAKLDERFVDILRQQGVFHEWPLDAIIPDREAFLQFLQKHWRVFLKQATAKTGDLVKKACPAHQRQVSRSLNLPFDHDDVRVYMDNLFLEGLLDPVEIDDAGTLENSWARVGIRENPLRDLQSRFDGLAAKLANQVPGKRVGHDDWLRFGQRWAELRTVYLALQPMISAPQIRSYENIQERVDILFMQWLSERYAGLHNQPADPPVMLHHVPRKIARHIDETKTGRAALIVVDGLSLDQWVTLRDSGGLHELNLTIREHAIFAWIPTVTSVSRQAAFSGKAPLFFPSSIYRTDREPALWAQFWVDHGLTPRQISYAKSLGDGDLSRVEDIVENPEIRVVGLVVDTVDKIMHGMELGNAGMHALIRQWAEEGFMARLIDILLRYGFKVYLTSDHGNIEATGCGRPAEGSVADLRGERVRVYPNDVLRATVTKDYRDSVEWPNWGLPLNYLPLLAGGRSAFVKAGSRVICHGGASIEEVLVPFVEIEGDPK